ncbi:MAG: hypothetical protein EO766_17525 [Hydrotalea sp. AMD]|uniref:replication initiator protein A n=1 Tax=Hydrotalea sp. AMD TaxID=2501297 RepID=UPI0010259DEF|nr:replication initiator protein A [Hydrotalea sp. AMD]RWZ83862.1 MAG: hypothetical protein EO766_17525 [Hydrotalea sp. AMD]
METIEQHLESIKKSMRQKIENSPVAMEAKELAKSPLELTKYRNERNLMLYPFCSTSKRKRLKTIEYKSSDAKRWLQVTANHEFGMAKIWDFDVLRFALSKAGEIAMSLGYFPASIEFTAYECLKGIGRNTKGMASYAWLEKALQRLLGTTYRGNIFRDNEKIVDGFKLISFQYLKKEDGTIEGMKISFDERLIESVRYNKGLLAIDAEVLHEESGIKKRLLELIKVSKGNDKEWTVGLERLAAMCAHDGSLKRFKFELKSYQLPWKIKFSKKINGKDNVIFFD